MMGDASDVDPGGSGGDDAKPPERTRGLTLESCYRHPNVVTGVHCTRCNRPICPDCMRPAAIGYQCPDCLSEARRTAPRRRIGVRFLIGRPGAITITLMALNALMFIVEVALGGSNSLLGGPDGCTLIRLGALQPVLIAANHQYWRLLTPMILHASLLHIAFNTYALYLFGFLIENAFGKIRFIAVYVVCGFLASVASFLFSSPFSVGVGASGAIFGLLGAWVAYNFRRRGTQFASAQLQWALMLIALNLFLGFSIGSIDNNAHIGGLIAGAFAGTFAEGFGPPATRRLIRVGGFALLVLIGVTLAAFRISQLAGFPPIQPC